MRTQDGRQRGRIHSTSLCGLRPSGTAWEVTARIKLSFSPCDLSRDAILACLVLKDAEMLGCGTTATTPGALATARAGGQSQNLAMSLACAPRECVVDVDVMLCAPAAQSCALPETTAEGSVFHLARRWADMERRRNVGFVIRVACFQTPRKAPMPLRGQWLPSRGHVSPVASLKAISLGDGVVAFHDGRRFWRYLCSSGDLFPGEECSAPAGMALCSLGAVFYECTGKLRTLPVFPAEAFDSSSDLVVPDVVSGSLATVDSTLVWCDCRGSFYATRDGESTCLQDLVDLLEVPPLSRKETWVVDACWTWPQGAEQGNAQREQQWCLRCSLPPRTTSLYGAFYSGVERLCLRSEAFVHGAVPPSALAEATASLGRGDLCNHSSDFKGGVLVVSATTAPGRHLECRCRALLGRQCDEPWLAEAASLPVWDRHQQRLAFVDRGGCLLIWDPISLHVEIMQVANPSRHDVFLCAFAEEGHEGLVMCHSNLLASTWRPASSAYFAFLVGGSWVTIPGGTPYVSCLEWDGTARWHSVLPAQTQDAVVGSRSLYVATLAGLLLLRLEDGTLYEHFPEACVSVSVHIHEKREHVRLVLSDGGTLWLQRDGDSADRRVPDER